MADPVGPLVFVAGDADGICDSKTGVCAVPEPDTGPDAVVSEPQ
ncbi:hypothetical protein [Nocardioides sp. CER19]|nr:hypothetical protein [Nocardioides sp. CER19]MDH2413805.1 hypothetical protein [Nocardioides sp. CER19]